MSDITYPHSMGFSSYDDVVYYLEEKWHKGGGGGAGLPEVTSEDNGDVLTVVEGEWAKAAPTGGGVLVVTDTEGTLNKTWQEINDAKFAVAIVPPPVGEGFTVYVLNECIHGITYDVMFNSDSNSRGYSASSASDYPARNTA